MSTSKKGFKGLLKGKYYFSLKTCVEPAVEHYEASCEIT